MSSYPPGPGQPPRPGPYPPQFPTGDERTTILPPGGYRPAAPPQPSDDRTTMLSPGYAQPSPPPGWSPPPPGYPAGYGAYPPAPAAPPPPTPSRRGVLIGAGVAVVAAAGGFATYAAVRPSTGSSAPPADTTTPAPGGAGLAKVADIPAQGGVILADQKIVLTRPTGDAVKAFTAVCTHQGCLVATVSAGAIHCPCHGSAFDISTGAVVNGPATQPLASVPVTVADGVVRKG